MNKENVKQAILKIFAVSKEDHVDLTVATAKVRTSVINEEITEFTVVDVDNAADFIHGHYEALCKVISEGIGSIDTLF